VTPTEAARRLRLAQDEYDDAQAAGLTREAAAYAIAVDVLTVFAKSGFAKSVIAESGLAESGLAEPELAQTD
jgi:hypothetical protein